MPQSDTHSTTEPAAEPSGPAAPESRPSVFAVWGTLRLETFRAFWTAGLFSLIGSWMQNIGSAWLMTDLSDSPVMVALVQSSQMIPTLFLAFIAGSLADMIDRRRYMIAVTWWLIGVTVVLAGLTQAGFVTPFWLIFFTLMLGLGGACLMPAMSATIQDIVPRSEVVHAVTLNSLSMNISRLIGPALAGLLIGLAGVAPAFLVNAFSYAVFLWVLFRWEGPQRRPQQKQSLWANMTAGLRYARKAKRFQAVMIRSFFNFFCGSALMALLPLLAREELGVGPEAFGTFMGAVGIGAIVTALLIAPALTARYSRNVIVFWASLIIAVALFGVGIIREPVLFAGVLFFFGGAWMICMLSFQVAAQMVLPAWVRARGLSLTIMAFTAGMVGGGILWGVVAQYTSLEIAFDCAAVAMAVASIATVRLNISSNEPDEA